MSADNDYYCATCKVPYYKSCHYRLHLLSPRHGGNTVLEPQSDWNCQICNVKGWNRSGHSFALIKHMIDDPIHAGKLTAYNGSNGRFKYCPACNIYEVSPLWTTHKRTGGHIQRMADLALCPCAIGDDCIDEPI